MAKAMIKLECQHENCLNSTVGYLFTDNLDLEIRRLKKLFRDDVKISLKGDCESDLCVVKINLGKESETENKEKFQLFIELFATPMLGLANMINEIETKN